MSSLLRYHRAAAGIMLRPTAETSLLVNLGSMAVVRVWRARELSQMGGFLLYFLLGGALSCGWDRGRGRV
jgi:hypothetical protein